MNASTVMSPDSPGVCVLIVEDDDDSRDMMRELVALLGHRAVGAANAAEALHHMGVSQPQVALIDIGLPEVDGCEVARLLRAREGGGALHLVALTGYSDGATRDTAAAAGFDEFVVKPVMPDILEALLGKVRPPSRRATEQ
jgi:CheY-like chemotaxis protein